MNAKKLLLGTLAAVASIGISGNTLAYYGETVVYDYPAGFYIGLQAGYAQTNWRNLNSLGDPEGGFLPSPVNFSGAQGDYGGRVHIGYDFNEFFAIELGFAYLLGQTTSVENNGSFVTLPPIAPGEILYEEKMKTYATDLVAKLSLPLDNGFRLFTKFGAQYLVTTKPPTFLETQPWVFADVNRKNLSVIFGVGAAYQITPAFSADLSWTYYRGNEEIGSKYLPSIDFYALGISYKFICS